MLPITRATLQSFCRICIKELPRNAEHTREPNHDINKNQLYEMLQSISGIIMKSSELNLYPQAICHGCYVKASAFLKFRDKAITATGVLRLLIAENLQESSLAKLQSYCRLCFKKRNSEKEKFYTSEKNGEVYNYMCECTGLFVAGETCLIDVLKDDSRFPSHLCGRCYATLKNFVEFRAVSKQTEEYLNHSLLDTVPKGQESSAENKKEDDQGIQLPTAEDASKILEQEDIVVLDQLPICEKIKSEIRNAEEGEENDIPGVDYDFEMPIEVEINSDLHDGEGIDLDAVEIKKELDYDQELLKLENADAIDDEAITRAKTRKNLKIKDEFEDWDSHSTESSNDSDFDQKKRKSKVKNNKKRTPKTKNITKKVDTTLQSAPRATRSTKTTVLQKVEAQSDEEKIKNKFSLSMSSANCSNDAIDDADDDYDDDDDDNNDDIEYMDKHVRKPKTFRTTFNCAECNKSFYKKYMYEAHIRGVHEGVEKPFSCQYCDSTFRLVQLLNRHVNVRHLTELIPAINDDDPLNSNAQNIFICVFCQRPFRRNDHLKEHIRAVHEGLRPYKCDVCGKTFGSRNTQLRHEKNHSAARPYACEYCGKRYNSETELKVHLQRHTTNPDLLCHICKRGKATVEELKKHLAMHQSSRQHQCTKCGKVFTKLFHLREHDSAVHLKLRPFKCSRCDQTFGIRKTLTTHERRHDPTDRPECCRPCDLYFKTKRALMLHMKKAHPNEKPVTDQKQDTTLSDAQETR